MNDIIKFVYGNKGRNTGIVLLLIGIFAHGLILMPYSIGLFIEFIFFSFVFVSFGLGFSILATHLSYSHIKKMTEKKTNIICVSWQDMKDNIQ